ncbi:MAG: metal-dependent hydrolase [Patescibacteria group bacterium]
MDIVSHAAWGSTIIRSRGMIGWAALSGALPDVIPALIGFLRFGRKYASVLRGIESQEKFDDVYMRVYYMTHSLIPVSLIAGIILVVAPAYWYLVIPYYLHIFLDVCTHERVWATRLLYPFSDFHFRFGRNWWPRPWISIANWTILVIVNIYFFTR